MTTSAYTHLVNTVAIIIAQECLNPEECRQVNEASMVRRVREYLHTLRNPLFDETVQILGEMDTVRHFIMYDEIRNKAVELQEATADMEGPPTQTEKDPQDEIDLLVTVRDLMCAFLDLQHDPGTTTAAILLRWSAFINKLEKALPSTPATLTQISFARAAWYEVNGRAVTDWGIKLRGHAKREMARTINQILTSVDF